MKSLMLLLQNVLADASTWCRTSTTRDFKEVTSRFEHEGLSFLTITLPAYCSDFERSLDIGRVDPGSFPGFKRRGALPVFLQGLLDQVFDRSSGLLREQPSHDAIFFIRQITLMFKKIHLPCSQKRERNAFDGYVSCESDVQRFEETAQDDLIDRFGRISDLLWASALSELDRKVYSGELVPKHGPGATADRIFGNRKFELRTWTERLNDGFFPVEEFLIPNSGFYEELDAVDIREPEAEQPVRVISVPKTLKTPRIIAVEPACMQYAQQALLRILVSELESNSTLSGALGFTDQTPNQELARSGSIDGQLATIDLSEASDRVSNLLVKRMTKNYKSFAKALQACRSERADVPGHGVIPLSKFASMGSAVCFPIEAMVFLTIILCGYEQKLNRHLRKRDLKVILPKVRVYGDDIIVPVNIVHHVVSELSNFGLKVNAKKSFWTGKFRESCGRDYYDGHDVTVTYVRRMLPQQRGNASEVISAVSLSNQLFKAGLWNSVRFLDEYMDRLASFPCVLETSPVIGRHSFMGHNATRICDKLHKPLVKGLVIRPTPRKSFLTGSGALLKFFLKVGREPYFDAKHLERYGRPESVDIKLRWASVA